MGTGDSHEGRGNHLLSALAGEERGARRCFGGVEEQHVSEMVFKELEKTLKGEDQWGAKMSVFKELVEHHIQDEESKVFKSAEKAFDHDEIQNIMKAGKVNGDRT
jgi:hemerythrin-like domain-containing protein